MLLSAKEMYVYMHIYFFLVQVYNLYLYKCVCVSVEFIGTEVDIDLYKLTLINFVEYIRIMCKKINHPKIIYMLEIKRKKET